MEEKIRELIEAGRPLKEIAWETELKYIDVRRIAGEMNLLRVLMRNGAPKRTRGRPATPEQVKLANKGDEKVRQMIASGMTRKQVAYELGVSRERVRQRMARAGIEAPKRQSARLEKVSKLYGLPMSKVWALREIGATRAFAQQRRNAALRGISWELTFAEWWQIWEDSGKWELRGRTKGGWVMGRHGDEGPYVVGNVYICTHSENAKVRITHSPSVGNLQKTWKSSIDARP